MAVPQGILRVHQNGPTITFQVEGQATVFLGLPLRRLAEQFRSTAGSILRVDLRRCCWMDSTFLGTLLLLFRSATCHAADSFSLISPSPECRRILRQMGVDRICLIREEEELPAESWSEVQRCVDEGEEFRGKVLQAHKELAELPGPVGESFRAVVRCVTDSQADLKTP